jgi:Tfp pilus assembly protein PilN
MEGYRKWLAFGTGLGIEVREQELQITIVRVRPTQTAVLGSATVTDYRIRPAAEWGAELSAFLRKVGAAHIAATVLLPRHDVIVRMVNLPGVGPGDIEAAIRLQIDSLHPFAEDDVFFSWARIANSPMVLVGIARREPVDQLASMFAEAGIKVTAFTFSAAALYSAIRLKPSTPPEGFVVLRESDRDVEVYGESPARPIFTATFPPVGNRALELATSELRLEPGTLPLTFADVLPSPSAFPASHDPATPEFNAVALTYATALSGACPWLSIDGNLLPMDRRRASSRVRLIPTIALSSMLLILVGVLAAQSQWADNRYLGVLQHEIRRFEPKARQSSSIEKSIAIARARTQLLDDYHRRAKHDLDALSEVTKLIPPPGWVSSLDMDRTSIQFAGEMGQAEGLLKTLDNSPLFERSEFAMPITRTQNGDAFRVKTMRSVGLPPAPPKPGGRTQAQSGFDGMQGYMPDYAPAQVPIKRPPEILPLPASGVLPK